MTWRDAESTPVLGRLFSPHLEKRLGPARKADEPLEQQHHDLAASMQAALEEVLSRIGTPSPKRTRRKSLCLAGGIAFNCVANGKIFDRTPFERVYVQPAAGDAGLSVGAAFAVNHQILGRPREFVMEHAYWGPACSRRRKFARPSTSSIPKRTNPRFEELDEDALLQTTAGHIADGKIVGWFQGAAEWGPRALGNRSILADPRRAEMKDILNRRIKHREIFRPFAPSILEEATGEFFEQTHPSPFMTFAYSVRPEKRTVFPRPRTWTARHGCKPSAARSNPLYWTLLRAVGDLTGVPVVLNTSFNDNEPIVCRPEEALDCFRRTQMDVLVIGTFCSRKTLATAQAPLAGVESNSQRIDSRKPRMHILLFNEYYPPDTSATAKMAAARGRNARAAPSRHCRRRPPFL